MPVVISLLNAFTGLSAAVVTLILGVTFAAMYAVERWGEGRALVGTLMISVFLTAGACTYASLT